ncbi:hypothetical protein TNCV_2331441 [Trichonephila clavipes]|nr:hypothetical protein TNCV_2331441 [Trichonephila clavipes]
MLLTNHRTFVHLVVKGLKVDTQEERGNRFKHELIYVKSVVKWFINQLLCCTIPTGILGSSRTDVRIVTKDSVNLRFGNSLWGKEEESGRGSKRKRREEREETGGERRRKEKTRGVRDWSGKTMNAGGVENGI